VAIGLAACWAVPSAAMAFNAPSHLDRGNVLETASGVETRTERSTGWNVPAEAEARWNRFLEAEGGSWRALWDADTRVPLRILGEGVAAPGATLSAEAAEEAARESDIGTRSLFEQTLLDEEGHAAWLELQLDLLERMGQGAYIAKHMTAPGD